MGIFLRDIIFAWSMRGEIEPRQGQNETNLGKQEKLGKLKISFWVRGPLLTIPDQLILLVILNGSHYWEMGDNLKLGHIW